jgi:hypothetical protein
MYYSYAEIEYVATSFSPTRTDLALKLLSLNEARENLWRICASAKMVPSMLESIFFYILQKIIQDYDSHFLCARVVTVFSGTRQQNFAGAGLLCFVW